MVSRFSWCPLSEGASWSQSAGWQAPWQGNHDAVEPWLPSWYWMPLACSDTFAKAYNSIASSRAAGAVADWAEMPKARMYSHLEASHLFAPVAVETSGAFDSETPCFLKQITSRLCLRSGDSLSFSYIPNSAPTSTSCCATWKCIGCTRITTIKHCSWSSWWFLLYLIMLLYVLLCTMLYCWFWNCLYSCNLLVL